MFTLVVFTIVAGATTTGSFVHAFYDVQAFGGGFDIRATAARRRRSTTCRRRSQQRPASTPRDFRVVASSRCCRPRRRRSAPARSWRTTRPRLRPPFLDNTTYGSRRWPRATTDAPGLAAMRDAPNLAVVDSARRAAPGELRLRRAADVPRHRLLPRGRTFDPFPSRARSADRTGRHGHRHRRPRRHRAARDGGHLDLAARRSRLLRRPRRPDRPLLRAAPGVDPDAAASDARVGVPRDRHGGRLAASTSSTRRSPASLTFDRLIRASWASA